LDLKALVEVFEGVIGDGYVVDRDGLEAEPAAPQVRLDGEHKARKSFAGPVGIHDRLVHRGGSGGITQLQVERVQRAGQRRRQSGSRRRGRGWNRGVCGRDLGRGRRRSRGKDGGRGRLWGTGDEKEEERGKEERGGEERGKKEASCNAWGHGEYFNRVMFPVLTNKAFVKFLTWEEG
jgi:hypothetical protein